MHTLADFLTFRTFVTPSVLLGIYYLGALGMPVLFLYLLRLESFRKIREQLKSAWQWRLIILLFFLAGELAWRIFIEFFVAYFQIRAALIGV
ncbi:DUF4282 domain-containing protein [Nitratifractor sp.]|uniref:DUF4282 domain-containing protein n=1 Tax=Nitratifractor sp. TaxID=2268144 RepID=UPI0025D53293|nr:DUF4282 domain-containing protein [Nitratifractor sp.]